MRMGCRRPHLATLVGMGLVGVALAGPVLASPCTDQIDTFQKALEDTARTAGAASSGGQAVAAAREGQAMQPGGASPTPPFQSPPREAQATQRTADAGGGGDRVMQAKASLEQAKAMAAQGNEARCMDILGQARRQATP
jgi:hypothetical protein